ncbi:MAG: hypothetical protein R3E44_06440 [Paracoccaceae bacterium]
MELILHIGVHRTGTTSFQQLLQRRSALLARRGISFWGPAVMRLDGPLHYLADMGSTGAAAEARAEDTRMTFHEELALEEENDRRLVIVSEENLMGTIGGNFEKAALYPDVARRLGTHATLFSRPPGRVYVAIRSYADYWNSAQAFRMRYEVHPRFIGDALAAASLERGWPEVLADVARALPASRIRVWRYTPGPGTMTGVLADMLGRRLARRLPDAPLANVSLSAPALEELARRRAAGIIATEADLADALGELKRQIGPKLQLFAPDQSAALAARFDADWQAIAGGAVPRVETFEPPAQMEIVA